jgi:hypothetical protein
MSIIFAYESDISEYPQADSKRRDGEFLKAPYH